MTDPALKAIGEVMRDREAILLRAVGEIVKSRINPPTVTVVPSAAEVRNEVKVPRVVVNVDMQPVADALAAMTEAFTGALTSLVESLQPKPAPKPKPRTITITHDDGSKSLVKEE